jgi:hypothetical protein
LARERRQAHGVGAEEMAEINDEIQSLLGERLPCDLGIDFTWEFWATAMLARAGAIFDSITALVSAGRRADAEVALRTMYEQVTLFCWIAIDPDKHLGEWRGGSESRWLQFHTEARERFGIQVLDTEDAEGLAEGRLRRLEERSEAVDRHWSEEIDAFKPPVPKKGKLSLKSFRGLYTAIYRTTSRIAHAEVDALQPYIRVDRESGRARIATEEPTRFGRALLALPLIGFFLLVYRRHFDWPSKDVAEKLAASMLWEPSER